jgi:hypothetical protein
MKNMARHLPDDLKTYMQVTDMTDEKYEQYGWIFLKVCKQYAGKMAAVISSRQQHH